jgi:hypothetical protein
VNVALVRYHVARWLLNLGARVYPPISCRQLSEAHYVGSRWFQWAITPDETERQTRLAQLERAE